MSSFTNKKKLRYVLTLSQGTFGSSDNNRVVIEGFRSTCDVAMAGLQQMGVASIRIFGLSQATMNSATMLNFNPDRPASNQIQVYAIDGGVESLVFSGLIFNAWGDYQNMPDVCLTIQANMGLTAALMASPPRSFKAGVDASSLFGVIARSAGYSFEDSGVQVTLPKIYLSSSPREQMIKLAEIANIDWGIDGQTVWIAPKGTGRNGVVQELSKETGLIGYPTFDSYGINFRMLYSPTLRQGGKIKVVSDIKQASGEFIVASFNHSLTSEMPNGAWFSTVRANTLGYAIQ